MADEATKVMPRAEWERIANELIDRQVMELRTMASHDEITEKEHDCIGMMMQQTAMAYGITHLSDKGWETFRRFAKEMLVVIKIPHESSPDDSMGTVYGLPMGDKIP